MAEKRSPNADESDMFAQWTETMTTMWGSMLSLWLPSGSRAASAAAEDPPQEDRDTRKRMRASIEAALKNWQALSGAMSAPESLEAMLKGAGAMPAVLTQLAQTSLQGFLEMQQKILEQAGRVGEHVDAYTFADIDENLFRTWTEIYEQEFSRFFQIPKLGLVREYQERISAAADGYNRYQATLNEFLRMMAIPIGRSFTVLQEEVAVLAEKGELPEDGRAYYDMWIKILEGHYMTLFQTPEYPESFSRLLSSLSAFQSARNAVIEDMLSGLPIPTQSETDSLYQEIHRLKRRLRALEKEKA